MIVPVLDDDRASMQCMLSSNFAMARAPCMFNVLHTAEIFIDKFMGW